jgi:3-dehydroquinate synthase
MKTIHIALGERGYDINIGAGVIDRAGDLISGACRGRVAAIVTNRRIGELYADRLVKSLEAAGMVGRVIVVPSGERHKTLRTISGIYERLLDQRIDRTGIVIGLGGGIVGDMAGFAAASYLRGIDFVQVPTSLLAQVDASIGGKTGVNLSRGKNLVGAFHQPKAVLIDLSVLETLPRREFRSGLAEIIKHGIIRDDSYFGFLEENVHSVLKLEPAALERTIERSCEIKADVVRRDEREAGLRRILNYGHTIGHAVERLTGYRTYKHGEAVAIGMVTMATLAKVLGTASPDLVDRIVGLLKASGLPYTLPPQVESSEIVAAIGLDKKVAFGKLNAVLVNTIGDAFVTDGISSDAWMEALEEHRKL